MSPRSLRTMKSKLILTALAASLALSTNVSAKPVAIVKGTMDVAVKHDGKTETSRPCPPFCIQPRVLKLLQNAK